MASQVNGQETGVVRGLGDVVAANSRLGCVDGTRGKLWYCGYDAVELARHGPYEETVYLLLYGDLPTARQLETLNREMARCRRMSPAMKQLLQSLPGAPTPMDALRTTVSALSATDPSPQDKSRDANLRRTIRVVAQLPTLVTAHWRMRQGEEPIQPRDDLSHAANLYYMLHGHAPSEVEARVLDMCLILMAEHEINASTFAVRVVASTLSDIYAAFTAGVGALNGPLHGAANTEAMKMLLEVDQLGSIEGYVLGALASNRRIMGFGHRVYKNRDPRAEFLRGVLAQLDGQLPGSHWFELAEKVRDVVFQHRQLHPNVDFYAAPALYGLGFPLEMFTAIFACARSAGWGAHVLEQYADNKLIRPAICYTGDIERTYVPLAQREPSQSRPTAP
jgi:citrate synthase